MWSGDTELGQSFHKKASWQEGKARDLIRAARFPVECQHQIDANICGFWMELPIDNLESKGKTALRSGGISRQWDKRKLLKGRNGLAYLYCFVTLENVSFYFKNCLLWFAVKDQTVSLDFLPSHTVLGNFTFRFESKFFESASSLAWNSKIKSKCDGFLLNGKVC